MTYCSHSDVLFTQRIVKSFYFFVEFFQATPGQLQIGRRGTTGRVKNAVHPAHPVKYTSWIHLLEIIGIECVFSRVHESIIRSKKKKHQMGLFNRNTLHVKVKLFILQVTGKIAPIRITKYFNQQQSGIFIPCNQASPCILHPIKVVVFSHFSNQAVITLVKNTMRATLNNNFLYRNKSGLQKIRTFQKPTFENTYFQKYALFQNDVICKKPTFQKYVLFKSTYFFQKYALFQNDVICKKPTFFKKYVLFKST